ncbi:enoyl-CoA hydratase/isomerase family protein [Hymenobacter taeanensis]|uniref:Enoyl-CoA hydratase/isomerase family protein n=1 Tax=Hymenobacter taeanensis TaxID=2735321 RepID=A0A6M6BJQ7_9BACT|nr:MULTISPECIES: enoyl-CoA hydratase/isomerase family protein [Hymenobacter]QJX48098.1 enoyl-CoA hydratase/isomerase family protein [Hymenobacter taeanensis]UOQ82435.1 enoyl-CoA hydratase/isomerase family protein [Hymenobacter sp. 5414T-23]
MTTPTTLTAGKVETTTDAHGVATISFFHPSHNSLPSALLTQLANTITTVGQSPTTKVIILKSEGEKTFCAGASFDELMAIENETQGLEFFSGFAKVINACRTCPKIIVGRVQGKAIGGGVGVAASTDYCFATAQAAVKLSELVVGIGPFVVGPAVERKIGLAAYSQLALDAAEFRSAEWAKERGLYAEVLATPEALDAAVTAFATKLAAYNPEALTELKQVCWQGTENWDTLLVERAAISGRLVLSDFTRESIRQFKSK